MVQDHHQYIAPMEPESTQSKNIEHSSKQPESKQELNQKTSSQFLISIALGVLTLIAIVAFGYFKLLRVQ
jgi:cobalamin biosynthesis Mg chelatase CobN